MFPNTAVSRAALSLGQQDLGSSARVGSTDLRDWRDTAWVATSSSAGITPGMCRWEEPPGWACVFSPNCLPGTDHQDRWEKSPKSAAFFPGFNTAFECFLPAEEPTGERAKPLNLLAGQCNRTWIWYAPTRVTRNIRASYFCACKHLQHRK